MPANASPTAFVVAQIRHALQQAAAIGAKSADLFTTGSIRVCARSSILTSVAGPFT